MIGFVRKRKRAKPKYNSVYLEVSRKEYLRGIGLSDKCCSTLFQTALRCFLSKAKVLSVKVKAPKSFVWLLVVWCLYGS